MQVREKVEKSRNTALFQRFVTPEGRKVGSLKQRVGSHLARWEMENCTPLWRDAHLEVKSVKTPQLRSTSRTWDVQKVHGVAARSTFPSQNVQNTPCSDHFWVEMSKKCTPLWRQAHFQVKSAKNWRVRSTFGRLDVVLRGRRKGLCTLSKVSKTCRFCSSSKSVGRRGTFEEGSAKKNFAGAVQETCSSAMLGGQGSDFLTGVAFWSIRSSGLLRWFCVTGAALRMTWHHFFVTGAIFWTDGMGKSQNALVQGRLNFPFLTEVSGNCFVFVVNFENWRSLAGFFRFWRCQVQKLRKSGRIASFLICELRKWRKSRRIAWFSSLQIDR